MTQPSPESVTFEIVDRPLAEILTSYADGDQIGWPAEFAYLRTFDSRRIAELTVDIALNGFKEPILLGTDGRIWDGHHRLCVADALRWKHIPTTICEDDEQITRDAVVGDS